MFYAFVCEWITSLLVKARLWPFSFSMDVALCYFLNSESLSLKRSSFEILPPPELRDINNLDLNG